jgi:hypothetical protein
MGVMRRGFIGSSDKCPIETAITYTASRVLLKNTDVL